MHLLVAIFNEESRLVSAHLSSPLTVVSWKNYLNDKVEHRGMQCI